MILAPGLITLVPTGLALAIPPGYEGQVRPRSGLATKHAITVPNAPGTIDSDYRGELKVALMNLGKEPFTITHAMRIAQLVIAPVAQAHLVERTSLDVTTRGKGGFGSTGH
jgi:dUTP pyrophosphatase